MTPGVPTCCSIMQMLYNSDSFVVVQVEVPAEAGTLARGGYEIVDKFARQEIFIEGALADSFERGVKALVAEGPNEERLDDFIAGYVALAPQPLALH